LEDDEGLRLGWEMLGKRLPVMLSTHPKAPQVFSRGKSRMAIKKWGCSNVYRGMGCNSVKGGREMLGKGLPVMLSTQSIK